MSRTDAVVNIARGAGRFFGRSGDDAARAVSKPGSRFGKAAPAAAAGAGGAGLGLLGGLAASSLLNALQNNSRNNSSGFGGASSGGISPGPGNGSSGSTLGSFAKNDNYEKITFNSTEDPLREIARISAISATKLSSIDNTLKNILEFQTTSALQAARTARESSIERTSYIAPTQLGAVGEQTRRGPGLGAGLLGGAALLGGIGLLNTINQAKDTANETVEGVKNSASEAANTASGAASGMFGSGSMLEKAGDVLTGAAFASDTQRAMRPRPAVTPPPAANALGLVAANDNVAKTSRLTRFLRGLKVIGRSFTPLNGLIALVDPIIALINARLDVNDSEVRRQTVGAIGSILGGAGGIAAGAALGGLVGSVVPVAGTAVGIIAGGLLGAAASIGAEFVAENLYDLIIGKINSQEFARRIADGAVQGIRRLPQMAIGAVAAVPGVLSGTAAAVRGAGAALSRIPGAVPLAKAAAVAGAVGGGMLIARQFTGSSENPEATPTGPISMVRAFHDNAVSGGQGSELYLSAKNKVETYLGRRLTGREWTSFIHAVHGETGRNPVEDAMIAGSILNRARNPRRYAEPFANRAIRRGRNVQNAQRTLEYMRSGETVLAVLFAPSQFQAVTGTHPDYRPSSLYSTGPNERDLTRILTSIDQHLHRVPLNQTDFAAESDSAYGEGTTTSHRNRLAAEGGALIGGSRFNTAGLTGGGNFSAMPGPAPVTPRTNNLQANSPAASGSGYNPDDSHNTGEINVNSSGGGMVIPTSGRVTSTFGMRHHPVSGGMRMHRGIDIAAPVGTPVVSSADGVVEAAQFDRGGGGNYVRIRHPDGKRTLYMHLNDFNVRTGDTVGKGQRIGSVGNTGASTGPHLHFEVRRNADRQSAVDPATIFPSLNSRNSRAIQGVSNNQVNVGNIAPTPNPTNTNLASINVNSNNLMNRFNPNNSVRNQVANSGNAQPNNLVQNRTGSGAPEPVDSPITSQYDYSMYWGAN